MEFRYDTYCGLYCGACKVITSLKEDRLPELAEKARMKLEDLECYGCKSSNNAIFCEPCKIMKCARQKGVEFCYECDDFPCSILLDFRNDEHPHHSVILKNLKDLSETSLEEWLQLQEARWRCPSCKTRFAWYDSVCEKCGGKLYNAEDEEKDLGQ